MHAIAFQDQYLDARADCWGCGRNNSEGLYIKSYWDGDEAIAHFRPKDYQSGHKGIVNGGLIATLIDCHSIGLAMAHAHKAENRAIGTLPLITYVTASITVNYLKPTPLGPEELILRAKIKNVTGKKTFVECSISASGIETAHAEVLGIRIKDHPLEGN